MKPHIKRRIITSPFDVFEPVMQWCIYEPRGDVEPNWFGYGNTLYEAWNDYVLEKMWWEKIVCDESGEYDSVDSIDGMIEVLGYPEGYVK